MVWIVASKKRLAAASYCCLASAVSLPAKAMESDREVGFELFQSARIVSKSSRQTPAKAGSGISASTPRVSAAMCLLRLAVCGIAVLALRMR